MNFTINNSWNRRKKERERGFLYEEFVSCKKSRLCSDMNRASFIYVIIFSYVDATGDVQTAALVLIHGGCMAPGSTTPTPTTLTVPDQPLTPTAAPSLIRLSSRSASSSRLTEDNPNENIPGLNMVEAYLSLLNSWRMWHQRAVLESIVHGRSGTSGAQSADSALSSSSGAHYRIPSQVRLIFYSEISFCLYYIPITPLQR